jgi:hypothetical protein
MGGTALPAFMDEVPEYTVKDGRIYICMGDFCLCMPIRVFEIGCIRGRDAIRTWQTQRSGDVIPFQAPGAH